MRWLLATCMVLATAACYRAPRAPKPAAVAEPQASVAAKAEPANSRETIAWESDQRQFLTALLRDLRRSGEQGGYRSLVEYVGAVEALLAQADHGELTKVQLLMGLRQVEDAMTDPVGDRITQQIDDVREVMRRVRIVPAP